MLGLVVDAYELEPTWRATLVGLSINTADRAWFLMRMRAERYGGGWRRMWDAGVGDRILRRAEWLRAHQRELHAAVTADR